MVRGYTLPFTGYAVRLRFLRSGCLVTRMPLRCLWFYAVTVVTGLHGYAHYCSLVTRSVYRLRYRLPVTTAHACRCGSRCTRSPLRFCGCLYVAILVTRLLRTHRIRIATYTLPLRLRFATPTFALLPTLWLRTHAHVYWFTLPFGYRTPHTFLPFTTIACWLRVAVVPRLDAVTVRGLVYVCRSLHAAAVATYRLRSAVPVAYGYPAVTPAGCLPYHHRFYRTWLPHTVRSFVCTHVTRYTARTRFAHAPFPRCTAVYAHTYARVYAVLLTVPVPPRLPFWLRFAAALPVATTGLLVGYHTYYYLPLPYHLRTPTLRFLRFCVLHILPGYPVLPFCITPVPVHICYLQFYICPFTVLFYVRLLLRCVHIWFFVTFIYLALYGLIYAAVWLYLAFAFTFLPVNTRCTLRSLRSRFVGYLVTTFGLHAFCVVVTHAQFRLGYVLYSSPRLVYRTRALIRFTFCTHALLPRLRLPRFAGFYRAHLCGYVYVRVAATLVYLRLRYAGFTLVTPRALRFTTCYVRSHRSAGYTYPVSSYRTHAHCGCVHYGLPLRFVTFAVAAWLRAGSTTVWLHRVPVTTCRYHTFTTTQLRCSSRSVHTFHRLVLPFTVHAPYCPRFTAYHTRFVTFTTFYAFCPRFCSSAHGSRFPRLPHTVHHLTLRYWFYLVPDSGSVLCGSVHTFILRCSSFYIWFTFCCRRLPAVHTRGSAGLRFRTFALYCLRFCTHVPHMPVRSWLVLLPYRLFYTLVGYTTTGCRTRFTFGSFTLVTCYPRYYHVTHTPYGWLYTFFTWFCVLPVVRFFGLFTLVTAYVTFGSLRLLLHTGLRFLPSIRYLGSLPFAFPGCTFAIPLVLTLLRTLPGLFAFGCTRVATFRFTTTLRAYLTFTYVCGWFVPAVCCPVTTTHALRYVLRFLPAVYRVTARLRFTFTFTTDCVCYVYTVYVAWICYGYVYRGCPVAVVTLRTRLLHCGYGYTPRLLRLRLRSHVWFVHTVYVLRTRCLRLLVWITFSSLVTFTFDATTHVTHHAVTYLLVYWLRSAVTFTRFTCGCLRLLLFLGYIYGTVVYVYRT